MEIPRAGILTDLRDSSTAKLDALFNTVIGGNTTPGLTIVLDFVDPGQAAQVDATDAQSMHLTWFDTVSQMLNTAR